MKAWIRGHLLFVVIVAFPTLVASVYYGLIASDVYTSESRFVVRSPQRQTSSGLVGALLQGSGISHSEDDMYSVRDYVLSRDALRELDDKFNLRKSYSDRNIDIFDRFPSSTMWDDSFEQLYRYYGKHVAVTYDPVSSVAILTVNAYVAKDAYIINNRLLEMSERLVNTLNDRSRQDLITFADSEVKIASEKAKDASLALLKYRSNQSVFEPGKQAAIQLEGIAKLQQELISTESELSQLRKLSPANPQVKSLEGRIQSLRDAIASEALKVTGVKGSFSARAPDFERLSLDVEFADKQLALALEGLETARSEALQKQLYLERIVQPNIPDKAMMPRRLRGVFTVLMLSMVTWGVASLLVASIREHTE